MLSFLSKLLIVLQICVWCWHHIIDMAEKDEAEGRCPACRTIYEKEKIVAMQANCERLHLVGFFKIPLHCESNSSFDLFV